MAEVVLEQDQEQEKRFGNQPRDKLSGETYRKVMTTPDIEQRLDAIGKSNAGYSTDQKYHLALVGRVQSKIDDLKDGKDPLFTLDEKKLLETALSGKQVEEQHNNPLNELALPGRSTEPRYSKVASPDSGVYDPSQSRSIEIPGAETDKFASRGANTRIMHALEITAEERARDKELALAA